MCRKSAVEHAAISSISPEENQSACGAEEKKDGKEEQNSILRLN